MPTLNWLGDGKADYLHDIALSFNAVKTVNGLPKLDI